jgi:hypothetical protein
LPGVFLEGSISPVADDELRTAGQFVHADEPQFRRLDTKAPQIPHIDIVRQAFTCDRFTAGLMPHKWQVVHLQPLAGTGTTVVLMVKPD